MIEVSMKMKLLVNMMPTEPKQCLFVKKITDSIKAIDFEVGTTEDIIYLEQYFCNINNKLCNLYTSQKCNKLRVLK